MSLRDILRYVFGVIVFLPLSFIAATYLRVLGNILRDAIFGERPTMGNGVLIHYSGVEGSLFSAIILLIVYIFYSV